MQPTVDEENFLRPFVDSALKEHAYMIRLTRRDRFIDDDDVSFISGWVWQSISITQNVCVDNKIISSYVRQRFQAAIDETGG